MKASKLMKWAAAAVLLTGLAGVSASARTPRDNSDNDQYAYVMMTGSNIPDKVVVKPIGTVTYSPVRVYDRREIDQMGRFSTEEVLRQDPSIFVHGFGQAGPNN